MIDLQRRKLVPPNFAALVDARMPSSARQAPRRSTLRRQQYSREDDRGGFAGSAALESDIAALERHLSSSEALATSQLFYQLSGRVPQ
ncbi:Hypothetical protein BN69_0086 [Methylocystis sp. SC2]|nr:Hypothetical protein BN69_0086 [Methylocystis sp. SC2]